MKLLLDAGSDMKAMNAEGETPLHSAARRGAGPAILQLLLEAGADIEARTTTGETPLHTDDHDDLAIATYGGPSPSQIQNPHA